MTELQVNHAWIGEGRVTAIGGSTHRECTGNSGTLKVIAKMVVARLVKARVFVEGLFSSLFGGGQRSCGSQEQDKISKVTHVVVPVELASRVLLAVCRHFLELGLKESPVLQCFGHSFPREVGGDPEPLGQHLLEYFVGERGLVLEPPHLQVKGAKEGPY